MSEHTTRWGIVGTGVVARDFATGLASVPGARIAAVASRSAEKAADFAQKFGATRSYGCYEDLASDPEVDVVYIATPNVRHQADCSLYFDAGKAILCEKPLALNAQQTRELVAMARAKKVFFMEAMWMRFIPLVQRVKSLLAEGVIGQPMLFEASFGYPIERDPSNRFLNLELGGGSLLDRGIYPLSLAYYLFGYPQKFDGQALIGPTGVDEQSTVFLRYESGLLASLSSTLNTFATNRATIIGTKGQIEICAPFYRPENIVITRFPDTLAPPRDAVAEVAAPTPSIAQRIAWGIRRRLFGNRAAGGSKGETLSQPLAGNGYNFEAVEVGRCLQLGLLDSPTMSLDDTVAIAELMDALVTQWNGSHV